MSSEPSLLTGRVLEPVAGASAEGRVAPHRLLLLHVLRAAQHVAGGAGEWVLDAHLITFFAAELRGGHFDAAVGPGGGHVAADGSGGRRGGEHGARRCGCREQGGAEREQERPHHGGLLLSCGGRMPVVMWRPVLLGGVLG